MQYRERHTPTLTPQCFGIGGSARRYISKNAELITFETGLTVKLSSNQRKRLDIFITALKSGLSISNLSDFFDTLYVRVGETAESSLKNIAKDAHHATLEGTNHPTFVPFEGFTGDGTGYLNWHFKPLSNGVNFTQNNNSIFLYPRINKSEGTQDLAVRNSTSTSIIRLLPRFTDDKLHCSINTVGDTTLVTNTDSKGLFIVTRNGNLPANISAHKNKSTIKGVKADGNTTTMPDYDMYEGAQNSAGVLAVPSTKSYALSGCAKYITPTIRDIIYDAFDTYMDSCNHNIREIGTVFTRVPPSPFTDLPGHGINNGIVHPCVLYFQDGHDGYKYWMYYEYVTNYLYNNLTKIYLARSNDGISWDVSGIANPIIDVIEGSHDPDVIIIGNTWHLYCTCGDPAGSAFYHFESTDGINWNNRQTVLAIGDSGEWDDNAIVSPTVYHDGTNFNMYYGGRKSDGISKVGLATSADGTTFVKYANNPILLPNAGTWEAGRLWHFGVAVYQGTIYLYYSGYATTTANSNFGLAKSTDGTTFTKESFPVLEYSEIWEGTEMYRACPMRDSLGNMIVVNNKIKLYYSALSGGKFAIGLAEG